MLLVCYLLLVVLSYSLWLEVPVRGLVVCVNQSDWEIPAKEHAGMTEGVHAGMTVDWWLFCGSQRVWEVPAQKHAGMTEGKHAGMAG